MFKNHTWGVRGPGQTSAQLVTMGNEGRVLTNRRQLYNLWLHTVAYD
jgi:hypothetical protein